MRPNAQGRGLAPLAMGFAAGTVFTLGAVKMADVVKMANWPWLHLGLQATGLVLNVGLLVVGLAAVRLIQLTLECARDAARLARNAWEACLACRVGGASHEPAGGWQPGMVPPRPASPGDTSTRWAEQAADRGSARGWKEPGASPPHKASFSASSGVAAERPGVQPSGPTLFAHQRYDGGSPPETDPAGSAPARPERLIDVWNSYLHHGDGRFTVEGLGRQLRAAGIEGEVVIDERLGDDVLGVDLDDGNVYLLPHFDSTTEALSEWFHSPGGSTSRLARVQRLIRVAVADRRSDGRLQLLRQGAVE